MATITSDKEYLRAVKTALREIVRPWEVLCGLTDIGGAYIPDIYAKTPEDYESHIGDYMDADVPVINKNGEVKHLPWDDPEIDDALKKGKYIRLLDKPKYVQ